MTSYNFSLRRRQMIIAKELNSIEYGGIMEDNHPFSEVSQDTENERIYQRRAAIGAVFFLFVVIFILCMIAIYGGINPKGLVLRETFRVRNSTLPRTTTTPSPTNHTATGNTTSVTISNILQPTSSTNSTNNINEVRELENSTIIVFRANDSSSSVETIENFLNTASPTGNSLFPFSSSESTNPVDSIPISTLSVTVESKLDSTDNSSDDDNIVTDSKRNSNLKFYYKSSESIDREFYQKFNLRHARSKIRRFLDHGSWNSFR